MQSEICAQSLIQIAAFLSTFRIDDLLSIAMKKNIEFLLEKKKTGQKIVALTGYDYPTAVLEDRAGTDMIFVGDSVGTNVLGYDSETQVTIADILHHLKAVKRGTSSSFILADLPYGTYTTPEDAVANARSLMENGADGVKLEGLQAEAIAAIVAEGIPLCGHLGLLPQFHEKKRVKGKTFDRAKEIVEEAVKLESMGVFAIVLELVPEELGKIISERVSVPTIGIGSGRFCDGQVLIVHDILGITPRKLRLAKKYQDFQQLTLDAIAQYKQDVETGVFPSEENLRHIAPEELQKLMNWLGKWGRYEV